MTTANADERMGRIEERQQATTDSINTLREDVNRRFAETNQQIHILREDFNRRFDETNQQIHILREDFNRRFDDLHRSQRQMLYTIIGAGAAVTIALIGILTSSIISM